jgi:hypothetical protein
MIREQHYDRLPPLEDSLAVSTSPAERARYAEPGATQDAWRQRYEQSVLTDCMRARGYLRLGADGVPRGVRTEKVLEGAVAGR